MPNLNSQRRSSPDARVHHQQAGAEQGGTGCMLRVRTEPECPEGNLRELTWDSNPNCGIAREREKKIREKERERENFPMESSNLRHCQPTHRTKDWANTKGELAGYGLAPSHAGGRESGRRQPEPKGTILAPEMASSTKLWAGSQLLTKSSFNPGRLTSPRMVTGRDQLPKEIHSTPETALLLCTQENKWLGPGRW